MKKVLVKLKKGNKIIQTKTMDGLKLREKLVQREKVSESVVLFDLLKNGNPLHYVDHINGKKFNISIYPLVNVEY